MVAISYPSGSSSVRPNILAVCNSGWPLISPFIARWHMFSHNNRAIHPVTFCCSDPDNSLVNRSLTYPSTTFPNIGSWLLTVVAAMQHKLTTRTNRIVWFSIITWSTNRVTLTPLVDMSISFIWLVTLQWLWQNPWKTNVLRHCSPTHILNTYAMYERADHFR